MTLVLAEPNLERTLRYNYVFRGLPRSVVAAIAAMADVRFFRGGDVIVRQYDSSTDLLVILDGSAKIKGSDGETLAEFGPGSVVGEIALIDEQPRSATVTAVGPVKVAVIPSAALQAMMDMDPGVGRIIMTNIAKVLCRRMRSMNAQASSLSGGHSRFEH